jgi:hypothetical protein
MARIRFVALAVVVAMALAACGGSGDSQSAADTGGPATPSEAGGATGDTGAVTGDTGGATGPAANVFDSSECADAISAWAEASGAAGGSWSPDDLDKTLAQLQAFADAAPDEISGDLTTVYDAFGTYLQALKDSGYDPSSGQAPTPDQLAAMQAGLKAMSGKDVKAASKRVSQWFKTNCGAA